MLTAEKLMRELQDTPKLKRELIMRIVRELTDSEAFMEAYPRVYEDAEDKNAACKQMAKIITRLFRKNHINMTDAVKILRIAESLYKRYYVDGEDGGAA